jgi:hypothetical protein
MRHIRVIVGRGLILFPNHIVYIQLWGKEVPQHVQVHVTRSGSSGEREWSVHLCSAYSTENIHLLTVSRMFEIWCGFCDPQMIRLWWFTFPDKLKVASSPKVILSQNNLSPSRQFVISVQNLSNVVNRWASTPAAVRNLCGRKDGLLRSTQFPACPPFVFLRNEEKRFTNILHSLVAWPSGRIVLLNTDATSFSKWFVPLINGFCLRCFLQNS